MTKISAPVTLIAGFGFIAVLSALNLIMPVCVLGILAVGIWSIFSKS